MKRFASVLLIVILCLQMLTVSVSGATAAYRTWLQSDSRWGSISFGNVGDTISKSGCAITSIAKLLVHSGAVTTDESKFNPGIYCNWLKANGGVTSQGWLVWSKAAEYSSQFSYYMAVALAGTQSQKTATIKSYVDDGYVVVVAVKNSGHYVAVDKVANGKVFIMDPANTGYTNLFDYPASGVVKIQIYKGPHNGSGSLNNTKTYDTTVDPVGAADYEITSDDGVNLRSGAGTSHGILTAIPYRTVVPVSQVKDGWGKTVYDGKTGWFTLEFAKMVGNPLRGLELKKPTKTSYFVGDSLDTAGMTVTALYANGTKKTIAKDYTVEGFSSAKEGSCKVYVTYQTKSAVFEVSIVKQKVVYSPGDYVVDSSNGLNLRQTPSTDSEVLCAIPDKTRLKITEITDNWGKTVYQGKEGWICLDYTRLSQQSTATGISVAAKSPCVVAGSMLTESYFSVFVLYDDGSRQAASEIELELGVIHDGYLPVTVVLGEFSQTVELKLFDRIPEGDSNFDGVINAADALAVLQHAVGRTPMVFYPEVSNVNGDDAINAADALRILQVAVGKLPGFETVAPETPTAITE